MEQGFDPEVKELFRRIVRTASLFLVWLMLMATIGIYFKIGYDSFYPIWLIAIFYCTGVISLIFLVRYIIRLWKK